MTTSDPPNRIKQCCLCGAFDHLAKDCPWLKPNYMSVLRTSRTADGFMVRTYLSNDKKSTFRTVEVPLTVWNGINRQGRANNRAKQWMRARAREDLLTLALQQAVQGIGATESSRSLGVSVRTVQRWRKEHLRRVQSAVTVPQNTPRMDDQPDAA